MAYNYSSQPLPPKMAQKFADRIKAGEGRKIGRNTYELDNGSNVVVMVSLDPPDGYIDRKSQSWLHKATRY
jgi:hypothetical protein